MNAGTVIRVVRGTAEDHEVAAVMAVLLALAAARPASAPSGAVPRGVLAPEEAWTADGG